MKLRLFMLILTSVLFVNIITAQDEEVDYKKGMPYSNTKYTRDFLGEKDGKLYSCVVDHKNNNAIKKGFYINEFDSKMNFLAEYKIYEYSKGIGLMNLLKVFIFEGEFIIFSAHYDKERLKLITYVGKLVFQKKKASVEKWIPINLESNDILFRFKVAGVISVYSEDINPTPFAFSFSPDKTKVVVTANQEENSHMRFSVIDLKELKVLMSNPRVDVNIKTDNEKGKVAVDNAGNVYIIKDNYLIEKPLDYAQLLVFNSNDQETHTKINIEIDEYTPAYSQVYMNGSNQVIINGLAKNNSSDNLFDAIYFSVLDAKNLKLEPSVVNELSPDDLSNFYGEWYSKITKKQKLAAYVKFHKIQDTEEDNMFFQLIEIEFSTESKGLSGKYYSDLGGENYLLACKFDMTYEMQFSSIIVRPFSGYGVLAFGEVENHASLIHSDNIFIYYDVIYTDEKKPETILYKIDSEGKKQKYSMAFLNDDGYISTSRYGILGNLFIFEQRNKQKGRNVLIKL